MQKVLIYTENYLPGGGNRYLIDIVNSIDIYSKVYIISNRNGLFAEDFKRIKRNYIYHELDILTIPMYLNFIKKLHIIIKVFGYIFLELFKLPILLYLRKYNNRILRTCLSDIKPDVIISCNGGFPGGLSCLDMILVAKKENITSILSCVSMPQHNVGINTKILYRSLKHSCDQVLVNSLIIKNEFVEGLSFSEKKINVIHNCVDINEINVLEVNYKHRFESLYNTNNLRIIGFVGRIEESKGIYVLLKAFVKVLAVNSNVKLVLVGTGEIDKAKSFAEKLGIKESTIFTGYYDGNIYNVINLFDIFVFPSLWEGLPYSILEAMALKKIIISTRVGGIPEVIENGVTGILVNPNDSKQLSVELIKALQNYADYLQLGENAKKRLLSTFSGIEFENKINDLVKN